MKAEAPAWDSQEFHAGTQSCALCGRRGSSNHPDRSREQSFWCIGPFRFAVCTFNHVEFSMSVMGQMKEERER